MSVLRENLLLPDADVALFAEAFDQTEADALFEVLHRDIAWRAEKIQLFGREVMQPRLIAWHGDPGCDYTYSGLTLQPAAWTEPLQRIRQVAEDLCQADFNCVLLNLYRDGNDSVGWHSDDEKSLGDQPVLASVSLGAPREFQLRHKTRQDLGTVKVGLPHGSLLCMAGQTQDCWKHQLPKRGGEAMPPRINLTLRRILR